MKKVKRGHPQKFSFLWHVSVRFLQRLHRDLGIGDQELQEYLVRLLGCSVSDGKRLRFYSKVVGQSQSAGLSGTNIRFAEAMRALFACDDFSAVSAEFYRPIFFLLDDPISELNFFNSSVAEALGRLALQRIPRRELRKHRTLDRPFILPVFEPCNDRQLLQGFVHSLGSLVGSEGCPFDKLYLLALLHTESLVGGNFVEAAHCRLAAEEVLVVVPETSILRGAYRSGFADSYRQVVFVTIPDLLRDGILRVRLSSEYVGSELLTAQTLEQYRLRWQRHVESYARLKEKIARGVPRGIFDGTNLRIYEYVFGNGTSGRAKKPAANAAAG